MRRVMKTLLLIPALLLSASVSLAQSLPQMPPVQSLEPMMLDLIRKEFALSKDAPIARVISEESTRQNGRDVVRIVLEDDKVGRFRLLINAPVGFRLIDMVMPTMFVSTGFFAGTKPVDMLAPTGEQILVGFEYSENPEQLILQPQLLADTLKKVPARMYQALRWLDRQPWQQKGRLHLLSVSLGALYMPVTTRLLQQDGYAIASHIYAFGGGDVRTAIYNIARERLGHNEAGALAGLVGAFTFPYNPATYLPQISGYKLVIHANKDEVFSRDSQRELDQALIGPKLTCRIEGSHIDLHREREVTLTLGILRAWVGAVHRGAGFPQISQPDTSCVTSL